MFFFSQSVLCFSRARIQIRKYSGTKQTINFKWPKVNLGSYVVLDDTNQRQRLLHVE